MSAFRPAPPSVGPFNIYFGWYTVAIALVSIMLVVGSTSYSFGLFVKPVSEELGLSRASTNLGLILFHVGSAVANPLIGRMLDRFPIKNIVRVSAPLFFCGMVGLGLASSPLVMALCIVGPIAFGTVGCGSLFGVVLVSRWFSDRRGRAISIMALGTSLGGMVVFPLTALLMELLGWRMTLVAVGVLVSVIVMTMTFFIRTRPDPDTAEQLAARVVAAPARGLAPKEVLTTRDFWLIAIPVAMLLGVDQTMLVTITPYMLDRGFGMAETASIMSATTASAIGGKLLIAWIADRSDLRLLLAVTAVFGIILCGTLLTTPSYAAILGVSLLTGLAIGGTYPLSSAIMVQRFGAASAGTAIGLKMPLVAVSATSALYFVGAVHDRNGSYSFAFLVFGIVCVGAICLLPFVRKHAPAVEK